MQDALRRAKLEMRALEKRVLQLEVSLDEKDRLVRQQVGVPTAIVASAASRVPRLTPCHRPKRSTSMKTLSHC